MTITVYTKPACVQCNATYKALDKLGLDYAVVDITEEPEARDYVMALGYLQAPVVVAGNELAPALQTAVARLPLRLQWRPQGCHSRRAGGQRRFPGPKQQLRQTTGTRSYQTDGCAQQVTIRQERIIGRP